jgi:hypothetical protein
MVTNFSAPSSGYQKQTEAAGSSEILVIIYQITRRHIPEDDDLNIRHREDP